MKMVQSSRRVENTVGKGEIARYEQFVLFPKLAISPFPTVFSKRLMLQTRKNKGLFGKGLILLQKVSVAVSLRRVTWVETF